MTKEIMKIENKVFIKHTDDGNCLFYCLKTDSLETLPPPKFNDGEFVVANETHSSPKSFARVVTPRWAGSWKYGEQYISRDGGTGGWGFSFDEGKFSKMESPIDILLARRITVGEELSSLRLKFKRLNSEREKLEYAIELCDTQGNALEK